MERAIRPSVVFILVFLVYFVFCDVKISEVKREVPRKLEKDIKDGDETVDRKLLLALLDRIDKLEERDKEYQHNVHALQNTIHQLNGHIVRLQETVNTLASSKVADTYDSLGQTQDGESTRQKISTGYNGSQNDTSHIIGEQAIERGRRQQYSATAFYATIDNHHLQNLGANQDITFDKVYTNVGNAYHSNLGVFVAPVPGTYVFSTTIMDVNSHDTRYYFNVNGRQYGNLFLHGKSSYLSSSSRTAIFLLQKGDEVSIRNAHINEGVYGFEYSCFTGFLLSFDDSPGVVVG